MKVVLLIALVGFSAASPTVKEQWLSFKRQHGKSYQNPEEEQQRISVFTDNLKMIEEHNAKFKAGLSTFYLKMNHFGDLLPEEVTGVGFNMTGQMKEPSYTFDPPTNDEIPESINWEELGAVTPAKDQSETCYSCWAFSTTGAIEGQLYKKTGKLVSLSEQQLMDCSSSYGSHGCNGGLVVNSYQYVKDVGGLESENSYPYRGQDGSCGFNKDKIVQGTKVKSYNSLPPIDIILMSAVAKVGPISILVNSNSDKFRFYAGGVFDGESCNPDEIDHGMLLVGYGSTNGQDYWLVKNSWSSSWGEEGFMRLTRDKLNACGISSYPSYPILE